MKIIKMRKSVGFLSGIVAATFLFLVSHGYKERHALGQLMNLILGKIDGQPNQGRKKVAVLSHREGGYCSQYFPLEAFLKTYQPEIIATLINVLEMAHIPLEDYFEALEVKEDWHKFQKLMGEVSLMVLEQSRVPEGKGKESAIFEIRERYIPKLIAAIESFKATFD